MNRTTQPLRFIILRTFVPSSLRLPARYSVQLSKVRPFFTYAEKSRLKIRLDISCTSALPSLNDINFYLGALNDGRTIKKIVWYMGVHLFKYLSIMEERVQWVCVTAVSMQIMFFVFVR